MAHILENKHAIFHRHYCALKLAQQCQHSTAQQCSSKFSDCSNVVYVTWWPRVNIAILSLSACVCVFVWLKMCEMNYGKMLNEACKWMTYCIILDILLVCLCVLFVRVRILFHSRRTRDHHDAAVYNKNRLAITWWWTTTDIYVGLPINRIWDCVSTSTRSGDNSFNSFRVNEWNRVDNQQRGKQ